MKRSRSHAFLRTHRRTIAALSFGLAFSLTVAYAVPPSSPYNPGETLDPSCIPGSSNCTTSIFPDQSSHAGEYLTTDGTNVSWASVGGGGGTPTLDDVTTSGNNTTNAITVGSLTVSGFGTTIAAPTNLIAIQTCADGCNYFADGVTGSPRNYRVYSYKTISGSRIYSSYITLSSDFTDDGSNTNYDVIVSWDAVSGADGYRVLLYDPNYYISNYGVGYDTTSTSFVDDGCGNVCFSGALLATKVSPSASYSNTNTINGGLNVSGPIVMQGNTINTTDSFAVTIGANNALVGSNNLFVGNGAASGATDTVANSTFIGFEAGQNTTYAYYSNFFGNQAGSDATNAGNSNFFGKLAGNGATSANYSNFFGFQAGNGATNAYLSNFFGSTAGYLATSANYSNFFGFQAGNGATNANNSNFFGQEAGRQATNASNSFMVGFETGYLATNANNSNFLGNRAGQNATNANNSNFIGNRAGVGAANAANSIFIGQQAGYTDIVDNSVSGSSILIGSFTNTNGFKNSLLLGSGTSGSPIYNTKANQFMLAPTITEARWRGIDYTFPSAQAAGSGYVLSNNGSGILSWVASGGGGGTLQNAFDASVTAGDFPTISSGSNTLNVSNSGTNGSGFKGTGSGLFGNGLNGVASQFGYGVLGQSTSGTGGYFTGAVGVIGESLEGSNGVEGISNGGYAGLFITLPTSTNSVIPVIAVRRSTTGTPANGIGGSIDFIVDSSGGGNVSNQLISKWTDATDATRTSEFSITGVNSGTTATLFRIEGDGKTGIATTAAPSYTLDVGNSSVSGIVAQFTNSTGSCTINPTTTSLSCSSDETLKKNITSLNTSDDTSPLGQTSRETILSAVMNLRPVTYNWNPENDTDPKHTGFIAQEVKDIFPDLVTQDPTTNLYSLNYIGLMPYTIKAIQEMDIKIESIDNLTAGTDENPTFADRLVAWFANAGNGIKKIFAGEVHTDQLCIGATCVTETQLQHLMQLEQTQSGTTVYIVPTTDPIIETTEGDTPNDPTIKYATDPLPLDPIPDSLDEDHVNKSDTNPVPDVVSDPAPDSTPVESPPATTETATL